MIQLRGIYCASFTLLTGLFTINVNAIAQFDSSFSASQFTSISTFLGSPWDTVNQMAKFFETEWDVAFTDHGFAEDSSLLPDSISVNNTLHYLWTLQVPIHESVQQGKSQYFQQLYVGLTNGGFFSYVADSSACAGSAFVLRSDQQTCPPSHPVRKPPAGWPTGDNTRCRFYYSVDKKSTDCSSGQIVGPPTWANPLSGQWYDPRLRPWYINTAGSTIGRSWTGPFVSTSGSTLTITAGQSIFSAEGTFLGVSAVNIYLSGLEANLIAATRSDPTTFTLFIVDSSGLMIAASIPGVSEVNYAQVAGTACSDGLISAASSFVQSTLGGWKAAASSQVVHTMSVPSKGLYWVFVNEYLDSYGLNWFFVTVEAVLCERGYYAAIMGHSLTTSPLRIVTGEECAACPSGSVCNGGSWLPYPSPSNWVLIGVDLSFLETPSNCNQPLNCAGAESKAVLTCFETQSKFAACNSSIFADLCAKGAYGPLCGACLSGYTMATDGCVSCSGGKAFLIPPAVVVLLIVAALLIIYLVVKTNFVSQLTLVFSILPEKGDLKVLWSTVQILSSIPQTINVQFPRPYAQMLEAARYGLFFEFFSFNCLSGGSQFQSHVLFASIIPLALILSSVAAFSFSRLRGFQRAYRAFAWAALFMSYLASTSVNCRSSSYLHFRVAVVCLMFVYQSIPVLWFMLLWKYRRIINPSRDRNYNLAIKHRANDPNLAPLKFLFDDYKPEFYFFEVIDMYRREFFIAVIPLFESDPLRAIIGCYVSAVTLVYYREASSFQIERTNILSNLAQFEILVTFIGALFFVLAGSFGGYGLVVTLMTLNFVLLIMALAWSLGRWRRDRTTQAWRRHLSSLEHELVQKVMSNGDSEYANHPSNSENDDPLRRYLIDPDVIVLDRRLGAGSFGEVFLGTYLGQECVIKSLLTVTEKSMREFRAEIILTSNLRHPNIIMMYGCCYEKELVCLVLEWASNGTLDDFLARTPGLSWVDPLLKLALDVARGMAYLHSKDYYDERTGITQRCILHRDLKNENILISSFMAAKISDFGTSRVRDSVGNVTMSSVGTPLYCAPELARGEHYDERVDVYSFGLVLLSMALKEPLLDFMLDRWSREKKKTGASSRSAIRMLLDVTEKGWRPLYPDEPHPDIPLSMSNLISRCYSHDPKLRPSFNEIILELNGQCKVEVEAEELYLRFTGNSQKKNEVGNESDDPRRASSSVPLIELMARGNSRSRGASEVFKSSELSALKSSSRASNPSNDSADSNDGNPIVNISAVDV